MLPSEKLQKVAKNTLTISPEIISTTIGASNQSFCYSQPISPLDEPVNKRNTVITVENEDTFNVAGAMAAEAPLEKVAVLNFASDQKPGGSFLDGGSGQEESLAYRSTLVQTLKKHYYPLGPVSTIWSPNVVVFRRDVTEGYRKFKSADFRYIVGVASAAGLKRPFLTNGNQDYRFSADASLHRAKIRQVLRVMALNGQTHLVLGAFGCGACRNPPRKVAKAFKRILAEEEFDGRFERISFAILDPNNDGIFKTFQKIFPPPPVTRAAAKDQNSLLGEVLLRNGEDDADALAQIYTDVAGVPLYDEVAGSPVLYKCTANFGSGFGPMFSPKYHALSPKLQSRSKFGSISSSYDDDNRGRNGQSSPIVVRCTPNFSGSAVWSDFSDVSSSTGTDVSCSTEGTDDGQDNWDHWKKPRRISSSRSKMHTTRNNKNLTLMKTSTNKSLPVPAGRTNKELPLVPTPIQEERESLILEGWV